LAGFLNNKSSLDAISRVVSERVEGASQLTVDRVTVYKNMSGQERGYFRIIPPLSVPDRRHRIVPEVILVRRWAIGVLGIWKGEGLEKGWGKGGQFTSNLRPRWTVPVTARRVPSK
jgi:hypothetical protein